ncbi:MAG: hypothetical protein JNJ73_14625 [Hyphomonadaceae bacterium]|nr:hypothetical protein [Hyphomonadaceae bacterium]
MSVSQLNKELRLEDRGESDGRKEFPGSDATQVTEAEASVVSRVHTELSSESRRLLGDRSAEDFTSLPQELETLAAEPQTVLTSWRGKRARAQSTVQAQLDHAYTDFQRAYQAYRSFRRNHGLQETEPRYDTIFWRKIFWLTLLFVIEVAANGWVIGQASPGGLIQGWTTALMISVLVVLTGTLIGMGPWRYLNYRGENGKGRVHLLWALPAVLVGVGALLLFAFYVAHYRSQLAASSIDSPAPNYILTAIRTTPFAPFEQLESVVLFVVALLIGFLSIMRGANWDDPYPSYGALHRRMMEERDRTQGVAEGLAAQVDAAREEASTALRDVGERAQTAMGALRDALARARQGAGEWDRTVDSVIANGDEAIATYRSANRRTRQTPEPRYFDEDPFAGLNIVSSQQIVSALDRAVAQAVTNYTNVRSQLAGAQAQLETEYKAFYSDELAPFLRGVSDEAATKVKEEHADGRQTLQTPQPGPSPSDPQQQQAQLPPPEEQKVLRPRRFRGN